MKTGKVNYLISLFISVLLALVVGGVIMALTGHDPVEGYSALQARWEPRACLEILWQKQQRSFSRG